MKERKRKQASPLGMPIEAAMTRRDRLAAERGRDFGKERVWPELLEAALEELPEGRRVLEVDAGAGLVTRALLGKAASVTAVEASRALARRVRGLAAPAGVELEVREGLIEDLPRAVEHDVAVVSFTPRRGVALARLLGELAPRVRDRAIFVLEDDPAFDWAHLARAAAAEGLGVSARVISGPGDRRGVVLVVDIEGRRQVAPERADRMVEAMELDVPFPPPRGTATRLVRYFLGVPDQAIVIRTDPEGIERLYGNLRTAVHRMAREEITVRRDQETVQLVRLPRHEHIGE